MSRQDALELISKRVNEANLASDGGVGGGGGNSGSSGSSIGINRSDSLISKLGGGNSLGISMMGMGSSDSNQSSAATTNSFSQAFFSISFVVQEREKLATWKKRYENQASKPKSLFTLVIDWAIIFTNLIVVLFSAGDASHLGYTPETREAAARGSAWVGCEQERYQYIGSLSH